MNEEPDQRAQRSVAELLARYGEAPPSTGRRRRRAVDDTGTAATEAGTGTAPQSIINRVRTGSDPGRTGPLPRRAADPDVPTADRSAAGRPPERSRSERGLGPAAFDERPWSDRSRSQASRSQASRSEPSRPDHTPEWAGRNGHRAGTGNGYAGSTEYGSTEYSATGYGFGSAGITDLAPDQNAHRGSAYRDQTSWLDAPSVAATPEPEALRGDSLLTRASEPSPPELSFTPPSGPSHPLADDLLSAGPPTERIPRVDPPRSGPVASGAVSADDLASTAGWSSYPLSADEPVAGLGGATDAPARRRGRRHTAAGTVSTALPPPSDLSAELSGDAPEFADQATGDDDSFADEDRSPVREWMVMATQIGVGVIGGAGLWLICEWLWQRLPVLALVVALAVITGLVWVVRRVRRAEDLQTTVIAVLVGLFVTVSPAALLLVGR